MTHLTMPPELLKAHHAVDKAVDAAYYGYKGDKADAPRVAFLFGPIPATHQPFTATGEGSRKAEDQGVKFLEPGCDLAGTANLQLLATYRQRLI
jgi:hypothetical protein